MLRALKGLPGLLVVLSASAGAHAADLYAVPPPPPAAVVPPPGWTVTLGGELRISPRFEGSSNYWVYPFPVFNVRRAGTPLPFRATRDGFGLALFDYGPFRAGPVGKVRMPRWESSDDALRGLGDVNFAVEVGAFAEFWWTPWLRTRAELRQGFGGHTGIVADLTGDVVVPATPQLTLSGGPRLSLASGAALQPYFGIDLAQSLTSGLPIYDAKGGVRSIGAGAKARYQWTPAWATHAFVEYERLTGGAANSPLVVQRGSPDQTVFGVGATYSFDISW
jgi:outer membrane protein